MKTELLDSILAAPGYLAAPMAKSEAAGRVREVLFYSGAKVERFDWYTGEMYDLSFDLGGADLSGLNAGAPVLNGHSSSQAADVIGVIESAAMTSRGGTAVLRFSDRAEVDGIWQDIEGDILRNVSMGVAISKLDMISKKGDKRKSYMATEWKPFEISVVPMGADPGAKFLAADPRLERLRTLSVESGAASEAEKQARHEIAVRERRYRVLGK